MTDNTHYLRGGPGRSGGSGPSDPGIEFRLAGLEDGQKRLEQTLDRMDAILRRLDGGQTALRVEVVELKGRVKGMEDRFSAIPTMLQLIGFAVAVLIAGGALQWLGPRFLAPPPQPTLQGPR